MLRWVIGGMMLTLLAAALGGCSHEPPPLQPAREIHGEVSSTASVELTAAKAPAKSDPAAVAIITDAIKAHTSNQPALLQKLKNVRFNREGRFILGQQPAKQEVQAAWPHRYRVHAELGGNSVVIAWAGDAGWKQAGTSVVPIPSDLLKDNRIDITGEWLSLLFPLTEPGTIVAPAANTEVNKKPAIGVRIWNPNLSDAILHFDKESKLLTQITYDGREAGRKVIKQIIVLTSRPFAGVTLPAQTIIKSDGSDLAEWTMTSLEPQTSIDPKLFEKP